MPVVNLSLGIACLQQGMQRTTLNRHVQLVQGFGFLLRYLTLCHVSPEASFNLGRAFQSVGTNSVGRHATATSVLWQPLNPAMQG